jgi:hypothetical protein
MTEITFSADDVQTLAAKLDGFQPQLSEHEHALLLCVIERARDQVEERTEVSGFGMGPPSFRAAFNLGMPSLGGALIGGSGGWGRTTPAALRAGQRPRAARLRAGAEARPLRRDRAGAAQRLPGHVLSGAPRTFSCDVREA